MLPVVTPEQMRQIDAAITEPIAQVIDRVGALIAIEAIAMMGGAYGRRVAVVAGPGNNGADGRAAADHLSRRGVAVEVVAVGETIPDGPKRPLDLVIDAAFGTGLSREYHAPPLPAGVPVLAVDIPSGYSGETGQPLGTPWSADRSLVLAGYKAGQLFEPARSASGQLRLIDIGVTVAGVDPVANLVDQTSVAGWLPRRPPAAHKWNSACWVIGGAPGMRGAATLAAQGAQRAGSGLVRLSVLGALEGVSAPNEIVTASMPGDLTAPDLERFSSVVIGPGMGRSPDLTDPLIDLVAEASQPVVLDADALWHLGMHLRKEANWSATSPVVLTPHDGEFAHLTGAGPGPDRITATQTLADQHNVVVLLKGPTTVVAAPGATPMLSVAGDQRLATAGSGDVLAGLIGALAAQGLELQAAAAAGAWLHGYAATLGPTGGLAASDLPRLVAQAINRVRPAS